MRLVLLAGAGVAFVCLAARRRVLVIDVVGDSMSPTFRSGERVVAWRRRRRIPQRGEVIVFETPVHRRFDGPELRIKRVIAGSGDPVPASAGGEGLVPMGYVAVAGDNPTSEDSRQLGLIPLGTVKAVVGGR
jgi:signal peptidase I